MKRAAPKDGPGLRETHSAKSDSESACFDSSSQLFSRQFAGSVGVSGFESLFGHVRVSHLHFSQREGGVAIGVSDDRGSAFCESGGGGQGLICSKRRGLLHSTSPICGSAARAATQEGDFAFTVQPIHFASSSKRIPPVVARTSRQVYCKCSMA